jgi:hypothetical protein
VPFQSSTSLIRRHSSALSALCAALLAASGWSLISGCGSSAATSTSVARNGADTNSDAIRNGKTIEATKPQAARRTGDRTKALEKAGDRPYDKTFDDIKFEMEVGAPFERSMLTPQIEAMVGQRIRIRGFMLPTAQKRGIKQFVLVRDNQECCFGPGAALYDCIFVEMQPGESAEFSIRPMAVTGTFGVREFIGPDGTHLAIYHLAAEEAKL